MLYFDLQLGISYPTVQLEEILYGPNPELLWLFLDIVSLFHSDVNDYYLYLLLAVKKGG